MEIKNISLVLALLLVLILFSGCGEKETKLPANDMMTSSEEVSTTADASAPTASDDLTSAENKIFFKEKAPAELVILNTNEVLPAEIELIIDGEKLYEEIFRAPTRFEPRSDTYENALTVIIDGSEYAPMYDSFEYHSVTELEEVLLDYFTAEYIDTTLFFHPGTDDYGNQGIPAYYKDYKGELYKWAEGDYFFERASYVWNNEASFKTISSNDDTVIMEFCIYENPGYVGNIWCIRHFTIEAGRISAVEHTKDDVPHVDDFEGSWAGYDKDGRFVQGYSFSSDPKEDYRWGESGAVVEYYTDGTIVNYDKHSYNYGAIMLGNDADSNWLCVETYSHNGFHEFTASKLQFEGDTRVPTPILTYKRVDSISIEDGKVVIK